MSEKLTRGKARQDYRRMESEVKKARKTIEERDDLIARAESEIKRMRGSIELLKVELESFDSPDTCVTVETIQESLDEILDPDAGPQPEKLTVAECQAKVDEQLTDDHSSEISEMVERLCSDD